MAGPSEHENIDVRYEVLTGMNAKITVFWDAAMYVLVEL
jgi:hypothetical protein